MPCIASALVFSGRPDPTWAVSQALVTRLQNAWNGLQPATAPKAKGPQLGYRGMLLICGAESEFLACGGRVRRTSHGKIEWRLDADRRFERLLLDSAPVGTLPPGIPAI